MRLRPDGQRPIADDVVAPCSNKLRVPKGERPVFLFDNRCEHVIGFAIEYDRRFGFGLDVDLVEFPLSTAEQSCQLVRRQRTFNSFLESVARPHIAEQNVGGFLYLHAIDGTHCAPGFRDPTESLAGNG